MIKARSILSTLILGFLMLACEDTEVPEEIDDCVLANVIEINPFLGCTPLIIPESEKNVLHKLVLQDHPVYDTIYTRLVVNHYQSGQQQISVSIDSVSPLFLTCQQLYSIDYPMVWTTELIDKNCP